MSRCNKGYCEYFRYHREPSDWSKYYYFCNHPSVPSLPSIENIDKTPEWCPLLNVVRGILEDEDPDIVAEYTEASDELLREYAPVDMLAAAVLTIREDA